MDNTQAEIRTERPVSHEVALDGTYYEVGQVDESPVPIKQVEPDYPSAMRKAGSDGTAFVVLVVTADGKPEQVQSSQATHELFASAAVAAVKRWQFKPGMKDGKPVATKMTIPIQFIRQFDGGF